MIIKKSEKIGAPIKKFVVQFVQVQEMDAIWKVELYEGILKLLRQLSRDKRGLGAWEKIYQKAELISSSDRSIVYVGLAYEVSADVSDEFTVVAVGMVTLIPKLVSIGAHIDDVVVDKEFGGHGVGTALMRCLIKAAKKNFKAKPESIELTSSPKRVAANQLYEKLGFQLRETNCWRLKR